MRDKEETGSKKSEMSQSRTRGGRKIEEKRLMQNTVNFDFFNKQHNPAWGRKKAKKFKKRLKGRRVSVYTDGMHFMISLNFCLSEVANKIIIPELIHIFK